MLPNKLDLIFPFIVFGYGLIMTLVLNSEILNAVAETRLPPAMAQQIKAHRGLALICLVLGGFWSLQNLWL